jgi:hypothetical protein
MTNQTVPGWVLGLEDEDVEFIKNLFLIQVR